MKALIDIPNDTAAILAEICERENLSRAEAIRQALHLYIDKMAVTVSVQEAYGAWRGRADDGLRYQERLRRDWDAP